MVLLSRTSMTFGYATALSSHKPQPLASGACKLLARSGILDEINNFIHIHCVLERTLVCSSFIWVPIDFCLLFCVMMEDCEWFTSRLVSRAVDLHCALLRRWLYPVAICGVVVCFQRLLTGLKDTLQKRERRLNVVLISIGTWPHKFSKQNICLYIIQNWNNNARRWHLFRSNALINGWYKGQGQGQIFECLDCPRAENILRTALANYTYTG